FPGIEPQEPLDAVTVGPKFRQAKKRFPLPAPLNQMSRRVRPCDRSDHLEPPARKQRPSRLPAEPFPPVLGHGATPGDWAHCFDVSDVKHSNTSTRRTVVSATRPRSYLRTHQSLLVPFIGVPQLRWPTRPKAPGATGGRLNSAAETPRPLHS